MFAISIRIPGLKRLTEALLLLCRTLKGPGIEGARFVITVKDTQEPVDYSLKVGSVTDAKGHPVDPANLDYVVTSSDEGIATIGTKAGAETDDTQGTLTFTGNEGPVTVNVQVETKSGTVIGSFFENFQVTAGDPAAITGGSITFAGLSEDAVQTPPASPPITTTPDAGATPGTPGESPVIVP